MAIETRRSTSIVRVVARGLHITRRRKQTYRTWNAVVMLIATAQSILFHRENIESCSTKKESETREMLNNMLIVLGTYKGKAINLEREQNAGNAQYVQRV
eukprot:3390281-Amphidinium_carterae.1